MVECHILNLWCWNVFRTQVCKRERDLLESSELCSTVLFIWQVNLHQQPLSTERHTWTNTSVQSNDPWGNSCILPLFVVNLFLPNSKKITKTKKKNNKEHIHYNSDNTGSKKVWNLKIKNFNEENCNVNYTALYVNHLPSPEFWGMTDINIFGSPFWSSN